MPFGQSDKSVASNLYWWLGAEEEGIVERKKRLTPRPPKLKPWYGGIVVVDTEGTNVTGKFTATAQWDDPAGNVEAKRFRRPADLADFLIEQAQKRYPVLTYCHNLEWDLQVLWSWLGKETNLIYERHTARRNGSALKATFDYVGRHDNHRKVAIRDSFALFPLSLAQLGRAVGLPKLRTPRALIPNCVNWRTGEMIESPPLDDDDGVPCDHGLIECMDCYDLRDVAVLHRAMRLYIDECDEAGISPALTRSAHAMRDFRTNYLDDALMQYTEKQNLRAEAARYGGRSQMLVTGLVVAQPDEVIIQADINSEYPAVMLAGNFPDAEHHAILQKPRRDALRDYVGWAWAEVDVPADLAPGPLIYRNPVTRRVSYPSGVRLQGAWTTDELQYAADVGCDVDLYRLEGCPAQYALDPFTRFINAKWQERAVFKAHGDARELSTKLTMNGFSGKFGMRWTDSMPAFCADDDPDIYSVIANMPCRRDDQEPTHYPDYVMTPWSSLIMARGRIMLHKFGMELQQHGARLLCCDTDSWSFLITRDALPGLKFGDGLGEWKLEDEYVAFRGAAPKEYALYKEMSQVFEGLPDKARAKGIGSVGSATEKKRAIDHYLRTGQVWYQRPQKTRSIIRGAPLATFVTVGKSRQSHAPQTVAPFMDAREFARYVQRETSTAERGTLWEKKRAPRQRSEIHPGALESVA